MKQVLLQKIASKVKNAKIESSEIPVEKGSKKQKAPISFDNTGDGSSTSKKLDALHKTITKQIEDALQQYTLKNDFSVVATEMDQLKESVQKSGATCSVLAYKMDMYNQ